MRSEIEIRKVVKLAEEGIELIVKDSHRAEVREAIDEATRTIKILNWVLEETSEL